jgi:two-component system, OmpR family, sensor histidine kinase KdpD
MSAPSGTERPRGKLTIYMGYAAGVGKTFKMLEDARDLRAKGVDVVIGYFEPHGRKDTIARTEGLEFVPRKTVQYRGSGFEEMDAEAILARRPQVALVDEFPHTNVPGCVRAKRWEDVEALLDAGIDVLTTMNIQHLESLNDQVWQMTGIRVRETIPDWVVQRAGEVVMVDLTPRALLHRLERGVVYSREKAERAAQNFFRESTLAALRELALRQAAHEVEHRTPAEAADRILIHVTDDPRSAMLIRRAKRVADFLRAECFAAVVQGEGGEAEERHLNFARNLHIEARILEGEDTAHVLVEFARRNRITQIFLARPRERGFRLGRTLAQQIVALATDMQVVIVSEREPR